MGIMIKGLKGLKGFTDLFQPESAVFTYIEETARQLFFCYGYTELRIPIVEHTELFLRGIGTETDVVQKEMYTFLDRKGRSLTLRPEATAGIMRAYTESKGYSTSETIAKFLSIGPMFRYERPQKGRMRQFHQINCECIGSSDGYIDAELIIMLIRFLKMLNIPPFILQLNSLGCKSCRPNYKHILQQWLSKLDNTMLCVDCIQRKETNPMRVLDCKMPMCKKILSDAPSIIDYQCSECTKHFTEVTHFLTVAGIEYELNSQLVRGLDYYMRTTFEVISTYIGAQGAIAGGGRYDGLIEQLGGPNKPGVGFACGIERLAMLIPQKEVIRMVFMVVALNDTVKDKAFMLVQKLRDSGLSGEMLFSSRSMRSIMRYVDKSGALYCLLLGEEEFLSGVISVKDMDSGLQEQQPLDTIESYIFDALKKKDIEWLGQPSRSCS